MAKVCLTPGQMQKFGVEGKTNEEIKAILKEAKKAAAHAKKNKQLTAIRYAETYKQVFEYRDKNGNLNPKQGLEALVYRDRKERPRIGADGKGWGASLDSKIRAVNAFYQSQLYDMMEALMRKVTTIGARKKLNKEIVRAVYGRSADNRFSGFASNWKKTTEAMRIRFNKAGGDIKKLDDWNLPQRHDSQRIKEAGYADWKATIEKHADIERMGLKDVIERERVLRKMYNNIVTEGVSEEGVRSNVYGMSKISNRHQQHRFIHFANPDDWLAYNDRFSDVDAYGAMTDHITMMSNEIAMMETLGPNPTAAMDSLSHIVNSRVGDKNAADVALNAYANISGKTNPHNVKLAESMETIRNFTSFAKLPLAVVSAPPDLLASAFTANYNGIPAIRTMMESIKILTSISKGGLEANRKLASELMMNLDFMINEAHSAGRFMDVGAGMGGKGIKGLSSLAAETTVRLGGLNHWTVSNKMGFHFNFMKTLADPDIRSNTQLMKTFERYGIDDMDISEIANSSPLVKDGVKFLDPKNLSQETAEKVAAMVNAETKIAVPEADARVRGLLNQGTRRGTAGGEILRMITMFKTFPTSMIMNQWARAWHGTAQSGGKRVAMFASLFVGTTIMGAGIVQLRRFIDGKEEVPWDSPLLWKEAMIQGGTLSILGDVFATEARTYGSMADMAAGPAFGVVNDILWNGILGTLDDARDADKRMSEIAKEVFWEGAEGVVGNTFAPFNMFATKQIWQRYVMDEIRRAGNPRHDAEKQRREMKEMKDYRQAKWW